MPDKPIVFLSSTMRSLRHVRSAIKDKIEALGYEVTVAEYYFRAPPDLSIPEACLENVERCDILVLIIDGTYGTPVNGNWLVRSEFVHAKQQRKAIYVMVDDDAWHDYKQAIKHPEVDPELHYGIHAKVVCFLREIEASGRHWIHPFKTDGELFEKLREQFSAHYATLLRSRSEVLLIRTAHLLEQMHNLYRQKNHVQALLFAEEVLRIHSDNSEALVTRAVCKIRLHGLDNLEAVSQGIEDCNQVIADNPHDYRARYNRANFKLFSPKHDISEVKADLDKLFEEFPEYESYFEKDSEFNQMMSLRERWTCPKDETESTDGAEP